MADLIDMADYATAHMCNLWCVGFTNKKFSHSAISGKCSVKMAVESMKALIYAMDNGKWPEIRHFIYPLNMTSFKERMKGDIFSVCYVVKDGNRLI